MVDDSGGSTFVQDNWTIPTVVEPSNLTVVSSIWPGLGTGNSTADSLVQTGSEQDGACELGCLAHKTSYYFWWEVYPQFSQQEIQTMVATPGDYVGANVQVIQTSAGPLAYMEVCDVTTGNNCFSIEYAFNPGEGTGSQAEWIVERTESCGVTGNCNYPSLNNFNYEVITNAANIDTSNNQFTWVANDPYLSYYNMYSCNGGQTLLADTALPSSTNPGTFQVNWVNYGTTDSVSTCNPG